MSLQINLLPDLLYCAGRSPSSSGTCTFKEMGEKHKFSPQLRCSGVADPCKLSSSYEIIWSIVHISSCCLSKMIQVIYLGLSSCCLTVSPSPGLLGKALLCLAAVGTSLLLWLQMPLAVLSPRSSQLFRNEGPKKNE